MLIAAGIFILVYVAIHLKNYFQVGYLFAVVNGDPFDSAFQLISIPGYIPTFILIIVIFHNIHNYPLWFLEVFSLIFNCIIYGYSFGRISARYGHK